MDIGGNAFGSFVAVLVPVLVGADSGSLAVYVAYLDGGGLVGLDVDLCRIHRFGWRLMV